MSEQILFEPLINDAGESKQQEFINAVFSNKYRFLCYGGAMGGGKTYLSMALLVLLCKIYPGSRWAVIREDLERIRKTVLPTFKKVAPSPFFVRVKNENTSPIALFQNGSQIEFYGENVSKDPDLDWLKGLEVNGILLEQLEEISYKCFEIAFIRAGRWNIPNKPAPLVLATINPTEQWPKERIYEKWRNGTLKEDWYYLPAKISDNPILFHDAAYMSAFDSLDPETRARYIDGDWDAFKNKNPFWYLFEERKHVKQIGYKEGLPLYFTFDFGVEPFPCLAVQYDPHLKQINVLKEFEAPNNDVNSLSEMLLGYIASLPGMPFIHLTGDPSGTARNPAAEGAANYYNTLRNKLNVSKFNIKTPVRFNIERSKTLCNTVLHNFVFAVNPECSLLIRDMKYVKIDRDKEGRLKLVKLGRNHDAAAGNNELTHYSDALRYLMHLLFYDFSKIIK